MIHAVLIHTIQIYAIVIHTIMIHTIMIHTIKVAFERINVSGPEPAELSQPGVNFLQWSRLQPVEAALRIYRGFYEAGFSQHSQML